MATRRTCSAPEWLNPEARWRPKDRRGPVCGYTLRDVTCTKRGAHYCQPRADRFVLFCYERLKHIAGPHARTRFILEDWQEFEIARPLFGEVVWSVDHQRYVRRYRLAYIVVARKNGKSELAAAIQLYMLVADGEESAEVYCAAKDTKQAAKVFAPALRMTQLDPVLNKRLDHNKAARRLIDANSNSIYEIITADAKAQLGHNPHAFNLDEVLSQPDNTLWEAMTTAAGARAQELMYATTTETNDDATFGAVLIDEAEKVQLDPASAPHIFSFVRKLPHTQDDVDRLHARFPGHPHLPVSPDPMDERNWKWPNPALDRFKSRESMRRQANDARSSLTKMNGFLQFQVNQRVQQVHRFINMADWDANVGPHGLAMHPEALTHHVLGLKAWAGLDLSSKLDMTAWCLLFEDGTVRWRFWIPEAMVPVLDEATGGKFGEWVKAGWITATDGDTIDYELIYKELAEDVARFNIIRAAFDKWSGEPVRQRVLADTGMDMFETGTTYQAMTKPMTELERAIKARELAHGGNPVAHWMADNLNAKRPRDDPDRLRPVKPDRQKSGNRIDGMPALLFALDARDLTKTDTFRSAYEDDDATVKAVG